MINKEKRLPTEYKGTLLSEWLETKIRSYVEPSRARTKRGERIGFSKQKYTTVILIATTNFILKELSTMMHISYDSLRRWNIEPDFRKEVNKSCSSFLKILIDYLDKTKDAKKYKSG